MVKAKVTKKRPEVRASIGHKIRRYIKATPVHVVRGENQPKTDHLTLGSNRKSLAQSARLKWYPADDVKPHPPRKNFKRNPTKLRKSIAPGQVLILLAGRFRGRRVVFLKQLPSGLLLVTGPFKVNGVPLKRVNQSMVIPTSTKVDVSAIKADINDDYFKKITAVRKVKKSAKGFFEVKKDLSAAQKEADDKKKAGKKETQKQVDAQLLAAVGKEPELKKYLGARFTLSNNDKPHLMRF
jgi:large subunit ribosomal protein L6e